MFVFSLNIFKSLSTYTVVLTKAYYFQHKNNFSNQFSIHNNLNNPTLTHNNLNHPISTLKNLNHPTLTHSRPDTSFIWFLNPIKSIRHILWNNYKWLLLKILAIILITIMVALFIYSLPGYTVKRMLGA